MRPEKFNLGDRGVCPLCTEMMHEFTFYVEPGSKVVDLWKWAHYCEDGTYVEYTLKRGGRHNEGFKFDPVIIRGEGKILDKYSRHDLFKIDAPVFKAMRLGRKRKWTEPGPYDTIRKKRSKSTESTNIILAG